MWDRPDSVAKFKALYILAVPRTRKQNIRRQIAVIENATVIKSCRSLAAPGSNNDWPYRHSAGAFYRRLSARAGKAKAVTATARKLAVLFYNSLRHGMAYCDPGAVQYEERYRSRVIANLQRRAKAFGFVLQALPEASEMVVS